MLLRTSSTRPVPPKVAGQQGVERPLGAVEWDHVPTAVPWSADGDRGVAGYVSGYVGAKVSVSDLATEVDRRAVGLALLSSRSSTRSTTVESRGVVYESVRA